MSRHAGGLLAGPACPPLPPENACAGAAGCGGAARDAHGVAQRWRARSGDGARHWAQQPPPLYRRRRPGNRSTCWWCGCHSVSAARASQLTAHAPRHAMITAACGPTARVLWQHAWALAPVCSTWLVSHARGCGHLPSGSGSRFVRKTRDEQRSGELAAAHPHMPFGLLHTVTSPAHAAAGQSAGWPVIFGMQVG